jgi:hypothetical protein
VERPQILLRQSDLIAFSRPPDVAGHAASEVITTVVDFYKRLFTFTAGVDFH